MGAKQTVHVQLYLWLDLSSPIIKIPQENPYLSRGRLTSTFPIREYMDRVAEDPEIFSCIQKSYSLHLPDI